MLSILQQLSMRSASTATSGAVRAIVCTGDGVIVRRTPISSDSPQPAPGEAVIRPIRLGVSGIDRSIAAGRFPFTGVMGHEFVGVVEVVGGTDVAKLRGARVVASMILPCGRCELCQRGLGDHCRKRVLPGVQGRDGCFADRFTLPTSALIRVPDRVDDDQAVCVHLVASAIQAARQLTIEGKPYITVLGDGPLGLVAVQVMAKLNASVRLIGKHHEKLAICEKWGIKHRHVDDIGRRADQDVVVDCTGCAEGFELATKLVRPRGTIVLKSLGVQMSGGAADSAAVVMNELSVIGSFAGPVGEAMAKLASHEVDVVSLISKRMSLADGAAVIRAAEQPGIIKVLFEP